MQPGKLPALTSARFFAAMYVVFYHTFGEVFPHYDPRLQKVVGNGFVAVSFFFTLSGYILATVYCAQRKEVDAKKFWAARFARIYPLFVAALILDTPNLLASRIAKYGFSAALLRTSVTFGGNLAMLQAWFSKLAGINNPGWSLSVETVFYALFPLLAIVLWPMRKRATLVLVPVVYFVGLGLVAIGIHAGLQTETIKFNPIFHLHEFLFGMLAAKLAGYIEAYPEAQRRLRVFSPWIVLAGIAVYLGTIEFTSTSAMLFIHDGLMAPIFGLIIMALASGDGLLNWVLSARWLVILGEASYGLYLIHIPFWHYWDRLGLSQNRAVYPVYLCGIVGISVLSYYAFETPVRAGLNRFFAARIKDKNEDAEKWASSRDEVTQSG